MLMMMGSMGRVWTNARVLGVAWQGLNVSAARKPMRALVADHGAHQARQLSTSAKEDNAKVFPVVMTGTPADGKEVTETLGLVTSTSVLSRNIFVDVLMAVLGVIGGPSPQYEELVSEAVCRATDGVATAAQRMDADQVINFRLEKAVIVNRMIFGVYVFVTAYGTAVRVKK